MNGGAKPGAVLYAKDMNRVAAFYSTVLGFEASGRDEGHIVLESDAFQLVVLQIPSHIASTIEIAVPPVRRERAAVKLVFCVPSIADVRVVAKAHGGVLNAPEKEWSFNGFTVCDGLDPEGNVIQFREGPANMPLQPASGAGAPN